MSGPGSRLRVGIGLVTAEVPPGLTGRRYNELWRPTGYSPLTQAVWPDGAVD